MYPVSVHVKPALVQVESHRGEQTVFPGPDDELLDGQVMQLIDLKAQKKTCTLGFF